MFARLTERFTNEKLPGGVRLAAAFLSIVNLPAFAFGIIGCWLIFPIPSIICHILIFTIAINRQSAKSARGINLFSLVYNILLILGVILATEGDILTFRDNQILILSYPLMTLGFNAIMLRTLKEFNPETK